MANHNWPGGMAPRHIAAEAIDALITKEHKTAEETWGTVHKVCERYPGCCEDHVKQLVRHYLRFHHRRA